MTRDSEVTLTPAGTAEAADIRVLCSTDPVIARDGLVVLADPKSVVPKSVVPPEHVFPLISAPAVALAGRTALARVNTLLTTAQLAKLTASVDAIDRPENPDTARPGDADTLNGPIPPDNRTPT